MRQDPSLESAAAYEPCTTVTANEDTPPRLIGEFKPVDDLVIVPVPESDPAPPEMERAERRRSSRGSLRGSGHGPPTLSEDEVLGAGARREIEYYRFSFTSP